MHTCRLYVKYNLWLNADKGCGCAGARLTFVYRMMHICVVEGRNFGYFLKVYEYYPCVCVCVHCIQIILILNYIETIYIRQLFNACVHIMKGLIV